MSPVPSMPLLSWFPFYLGDAVPKPLGFSALGQKHDNKDKATWMLHRVAHAPGSLRRSGCFPAEPYPPQRRIYPTQGCTRRARAGTGNPSSSAQRVLHGISLAPSQRHTHLLPCFWPKAINPGGVGAESPRRRHMQLRTDRLMIVLAQPLGNSRTCGIPPRGITSSGLNR
jgi:hypothetical protein